MPKPLFSHVMNLRKDMPTAGSITTGMLADGAVTWPKTNLQSCARVGRVGTAQSIPSGVSTAVVFDSVSVNLGGLYSAGSPDRFTIQQAGYYVAGGSLQIADSAGGNYRVLQMAIAGNTYALTSLVPGIFQCLSITTLAGCNAGDVVQLFIVQNSGGALTLPPTNVQPNMWIARIA